MARKRTTVAVRFSGMRTKVASTSRCTNSSARCEADPEIHRRAPEPRRATRSKTSANTKNRSSRCDELLAGHADFPRLDKRLPIGEVYYLKAKALFYLDDLEGAAYS